MRGDRLNENTKRRGWEPGAILNWLALAGWGTQSHQHSSDTPPPHSSSPKHAPDSTTVMSLSEMVEAVRRNRHVFVSELTVHSHLVRAFFHYAPAHSSRSDQTGVPQ